MRPTYATHERISLCVLCGKIVILLDLNPVARMYLMAISRDNDRGRPFFHIQHHAFANDFSEVCRATFLGHPRRHYFTLRFITFFTAGLVRETTSTVGIALKVAIAGTYVFPIRRQKQIAFIQRSEDRKMIAVMNVVLGTKIDVHNKVFGYCLGTVTGHYGDHLTIFRPLDK